MDEGGSRNGASLSEEDQCRGPLGSASLLGTLEDMLRKALDTNISLHRGTRYVRREPGIRMGACIQMTLKDEWRALGMGHLCPRGAWKEESFTGDPKIYIK
jgi:hypothetical protein